MGASGDIRIYNEEKLINAYKKLHNLALAHDWHYKYLTLSGRRWIVDYVDNMGNDGARGGDGIKCISQTSYETDMAAQERVTEFLDSIEPEDEMEVWT